MNYKTFYSEFGKLLYAVAMADGSIHKNEYARLKTVVSDMLVPAEKNTDSYGTDTAHYAEIEFDYLVENNGEADVCLESFIAFMDKHKTAISNDLRERIYTCTYELARSYKGITNNESTVLIRLWEELSRIFETK